MSGMKRFMLVVCALCAVSFSNGCAGTGTAAKEECEHGGHNDSRIRGRDIVEKGQSATLAGTLKQEGNEWVLMSNGKKYDIHFGKESYREEQGVKLKEGKSVKIDGFKLGDDVAVRTLTMDGKTTRFRDKNGRPMWAGRGEGGGRRRGRK